jgi:hypothetical protein
MQHHKTYTDGTQSASTINCDEIGCCESYLNGLKSGKWRSISQLNCISSNGKSKVYNNGKDADTTTVFTERIEFTGKCPTIIVGDKNSLVQDCQDSTINLTLGKIVLTLGGFTLFGFGISHFIQFIIKKKKQVL